MPLFSALAKPGACITNEKLLPSSTADGCERIDWRVFGVIREKRDLNVLKYFLTLRQSLK